MNTGAIVMTTKSKLIGVFDHYDVSEHTYEKNGVTKTYFNPKIVLAPVIDTTTGKQITSVSFNLGSGFKRFGLLTEKTEFMFEAKRNDDNTFSYPSNIIKLDENYQAIPDLGNDLLAGMIMEHNYNLGRTDTLLNQDVINKWKTYIEKN